MDTVVPGFSGAISLRIDFAPKKGGISFCRFAKNGAGHACGLGRVYGI
jgi:hypothetical protein